jgi:thioredoxin-related protein
MMKRVLLIVMAVFALSPVLMAEDKKKKPAKQEVNENEIQWLSIDEVQVAMKKAPKRVFMDVYTGWCGWCKVMDKKTFTNPEVIRYINKNFYAVKFDAERQDSIRFMGKMYGFVADYKAHMLAVELLRGQMSYPTSVILEENFQSPQVVPGYLDVPTIERVLKYINENSKTKTWEDYSKEFKPSWEEAQG